MLSEGLLVQFYTFHCEVSSGQFLHFLLDGFEVAFSDRVHGKIVVEPTVDGRADGGQRTWIQFHHGLSEKVCSRMAKDMNSFFRIR